MQSLGLDDVNEIGGPRASARCGSHMTDEWAAAGLWDAYRADFKERFSNVAHVARPSPLGVEHYYDTYVGRQAVRWLEGYHGESPWFLWASFGGPHEPWDAPEPYASLYPSAAMPPPRPRPAWADEPDARRRGVLHAKLAKPVTFRDGEVAALRANYAGEVTLIDEQIGRLLAAVAARGELDNTIIAHTSDHGEMNGDCGLIYKNNFLDPALLVPLTVRTPATARGPQAGAVCASPVEFFDLGPTLVELAGAKLTHRQFAQSLVPALRDPTVRLRDVAVSEITGEVMALTPEWKLIVNGAGVPSLLFDRRCDPDEQVNRVADPACRDVVSELSAALLARLVSCQVAK